MTPQWPKLAPPTHSQQAEWLRPPGLQVSNDSPYTPRRAGGGFFCCLCCLLRTHADAATQAWLVEGWDQCQSNNVSVIDLIQPKGIATVGVGKGPQRHRHFAATALAAQVG